MSIILVGLPGSGKTTVGRQLARRLSLPFVDSDQVLEQQLGGSIRDFFEREGEAKFRDCEAQALDALTQGPATVVLSTGGGACMRDQTRVLLRQRGQVVYLRSAPEDIYRRIKHDRGRPLLLVDDPLKKLRELYLQRDPQYRECAHFVVDTGKPSVNALVQLILTQLGLAGALPGATPVPATLSA